MPQLEPIVARTIVSSGIDAERGDAAVMLHPLPEDLDSATRRGSPVFASFAPSDRASSVGKIEFTDSSSLDQRLRGASLRLPRLRTCPLPTAPGDEVLALADGKPVWLQRRLNGQSVHLAGVSPCQLNGRRYVDWAEDDGQVVGMVPLIHFLRRLDDRYPSASARACFVIDDPNLRWQSFGYLRYRELAQDAMNNGYHVSAALIPLDTLLFNPGVVRLFEEYPEALSVSIHGNNHTHEEWDEPDPDVALRSMAQAIRRVERFERRTGLAIDRVGAPPHGVISIAALRAARICGLDAIALTPRTIPDPRRYSGEASGIGPALVGRESAALLLRRPLRADLSWAAVHAFLNQPIILYLHHQDLVEGPQVLRETAKRINDFGEVTWCSLGEIARSCYVIRVDGETARIRLFTPRVQVRIPDTATSATVEYPVSAPGSTVRIRCGGTEVSRNLGEPVAVDPAATLNISVLEESIDPYSIPPPRRHPWPVIRRVATETRDRLRPVLRR